MGVSKGLFREAVKRSSEKTFGLSGSLGRKMRCVRAREERMPMSCGRRARGKQGGREVAGKGFRPGGRRFSFVF